MARGQTCGISESREQQSLFEWAVWMSGRYPDLELLYHIPNEGKRSRATGGRMKREGMRAGVPDVCLPVPRGKYCGLYIEMKSASGKVTENQKGWLEKLKQAGHCTRVCYSFEEARDLLLNYLGGTI